MAESDKENEDGRRKAELYRLLEEVELTRVQRAFIDTMLEDDEENGLDDPE